MGAVGNIQRCRIAIPIYRPLSEAEYVIMGHNISTLKSFQAVLIGGSRQCDLLDDTRRGLSDFCNEEIFVETFHDHYFRSVIGYNELLSGLDFFERFSNSSYVLICQHDAIVLKPDLDEWLDAGYAFVGAPMFEGYQAPRRPLQFLRTLNGGFSLRHVPSALAVFRNAVFLRRNLGVRLAEKLGLINGMNGLLPLVGEHRFVIRPKGLNEDVFWTGEIAAAFKNFRVPPPQVASQFAFEACPADLFQQTGGRLPFGCHAFARYDPEFWVTHAPKELVPSLVSLASSNAD